MPKGRRHHIKDTAQFSSANAADACRKNGLNDLAGIQSKSGPIRGNKFLKIIGY